MSWPGAWLLNPLRVTERRAMFLVIHHHRPRVQLRNRSHEWIRAMLLVIAEDLAELGQHQLN